MADQLKIKIIGSLNTGATIGEINTAIAGIEKKIAKLKLKIEVSDSVMSTLNNFNKQMQKISQTATNTGKVIESALMPDGTKVTRTFFDGMHNGFQQTIEDAKRAGKELKQVAGGVESQAKSVQELTADYKKLAKEIKNSNPDGTLKSKTSTYLNDKGNARVIKTDAQNNVISIKDIKNIEAFEKAQKSVQKSLQDLAKTGKFTSEELRKIGTSIHTADSIKQIEQLKNRMSNMKFGTNIKKEQESLTLGFKKLFDQGKIGESTFNKFNNLINSAKNIKELEKIEQKLKRVSDSSNNKQIQQKLISDAQTLLRTHSKTVDTAGVNAFIQSLQRIPVNARNASNSLSQAQVAMSNFQNTARDASRSSMTVMDAFRTAMVKFPVWMAATTA